MRKLRRKQQDDFSTFQQQLSTFQHPTKTDFGYQIISFQIISFQIISFSVHIIFSSYHDSWLIRDRPFSIPYTFQRICRGGSRPSRRRAFVKTKRMLRRCAFCRVRRSTRVFDVPLGRDVVFLSMGFRSRNRPSFCG